MKIERLGDAARALMEPYPLLRAMMRYCDYAAYALCALLVFHQFFSLGDFLSSLFPYLFWALVALCFPARKYLALTALAIAQGFAQLWGMLRGLFHIAGAPFHWGYLFGAALAGFLFCLFFSLYRHSCAPRPTAAPAPNETAAPAAICPRCGMRYEHPVRFCGRCGGAMDPPSPGAPENPA